jgi:hypothetical protein
MGRSIGLPRRGTVWPARRLGTPGEPVRAGAPGGSAPTGAHSSYDSDHVRLPPWPPTRVRISGLGACIAP